MYSITREYFLVLEYGYCMHNFNDVQNILASTQNDVLSMHIMHITLEYAYYIVNTREYY